MARGARLENSKILIANRAQEVEFVLVGVIVVCPKDILPAHTERVLWRGLNRVRKYRLFCNVAYISSDVAGTI